MNNEIQMDEARFTPIRIVTLTETVSVDTVIPRFTKFRSYELLQ
jgi:hypothetical protein